MKIGVIGIGVMGDPIARNLKKAGLHVTVYSRRPESCEPLREAGIAVAASAAQAVEASDATILMLPGHKDIDAVLARDAQGRIGIPVEGKTLVLMATVAPAYSLALEQAVRAAGARYVEAPVSGSKTPAQAGQLVVLAAAADPAQLDALQPAFDAIGKRTVRCGAVPGAMRMKLANNLLLVASFEAITEAVHFAGAIGLDVRQFLEMAQAGPLANDVLRMKAPKLLADDFERQAAISQAFKDIGFVCDEAEALGLWLPAARTNRIVFGEAMRRGQGDEDVIGVIKVLRDGEPSQAQAAPRG
jgi:3-hydroxyisobutyrate dehydrogenase